MGACHQLFAACAGRGSSPLWKGRWFSRMRVVPQVDGKRRSIRLGKVSHRQAEAVKLRVEALNAALISKCPLDNETAAWVAGTGDELAGKLAAVGLIPERASTSAVSLALIDGGDGSSRVGVPRR